MQTNSQIYAPSLDTLKIKAVNSSIDVVKVELVLSEDKSVEQKNSDDLTNTKQLYSAWKDSLTPQQATNKYLWTYLSHHTYYEYVVKRWMQKPVIATIKTRFFMNTNQGKFDNAIARL